MYLPLENGFDIVHSSWQRPISLLTPSYDSFDDGDGSVVEELTSGDDDNGAGGGLIEATGLLFQSLCLTPVYDERVHHEARIGCKTLRSKLSTFLALKGRNMSL